MCLSKRVTSQGVWAASRCWKMWGNGFSPGASRRDAALTPCFYPSGDSFQAASLQNCKIIKLCCFKPLQFVVIGYSSNRKPIYPVSINDPPPKKKFWTLYSPKQSVQLLHLRCFWLFSHATVVNLLFAVPQKVLVHSELLAYCPDSHSGFRGPLRDTAPSTLVLQLLHWGSAFPLISFPFRNLHPQGLDNSPFPDMKT